MSSNLLYDLIEDVVISVLESGVKLPMEFKVTIPDDHLQALIRSGLQLADKTPVPDTERSVMLNIAGHWLTVAVESNEPEEAVEREFH